MRSKSKRSYSNRDTSFYLKTQPNLRGLNRDIDTMIQTYKEKVSNPFWIPKNNSELFQLRTLKRQEKEIKKKANKQRQNYNDQLSRLHRTELHEKVSSRLYLRTDTNFNPIGKLVLGQAYDPMNIEILQDVNKDKDLQRQKDTLEQEIINKGLKDKISRINTPNNSIRNFMLKTREIIEMKYAINVKKERAVRLQETYDNEIESIKDTFSSMKQAKELFEKEFLVKFDAYVKYCKHQKETERLELTKMQDERNKNEFKLKEMDTKKTKLNDKKKKFVEYRNFLISIKVGHSFKKVEEIIQKLESKHESTLFKTEVKPIVQAFTKSPHKFKDKKGSVVVSLPEEEDESRMREELLFREIKKYISSKDNIFSSGHELTEEIKKIEGDNINYLNKYNELSKALNELQLEHSKKSKEIETSNEFLLRDIQVKEKILADLTAKNLSLKEEKKQREHRNRNGSTTVNKFYEGMIESRIRELHKLTLLIDKEKKKEDDSSLISKMAKIEKTLQFLLDRKEYYKASDQKANRLVIKEKKIEEQKKKQKTEEKKVLEKSKFEKLKRDILEKSSKVYIKNKREITKKLRPRDRETLQNEDFLKSDSDSSKFIYYSD